MDKAAAEKFLNRWNSIESVEKPARKKASSMNSFKKMISAHKMGLFLGFKGRSAKEQKEIRQVRRTWNLLADRIS